MEEWGESGENFGFLLKTQQEKDFPHLYAAIRSKKRLEWEMLSTGMLVVLLYHLFQAGIEAKKKLKSEMVFAHRTSSRSIIG